MSSSVTPLSKEDFKESDYIIATFRDVNGVLKCTFLDFDHPKCIGWVGRRVADGTLVEICGYNLPEEP